MSQQCIKLTQGDLQLNCKEMALYLLGKLLVRKLGDGTILKGRIVETECYLGGEDKASHSYGGRKTPANEPMYMEPGTAYVYMTYGMYFCFNISSAEPGAAVLIRALEPIEGISIMQNLRSVKTPKRKRALKESELCNGPSKLCIAMNIKKDNCNKINLGDGDFLWFENDGVEIEEKQIVTTSRIGIDSVVEEWAKKPLRFYILSNSSVSKRDKGAESSLSINNVK